LFHRSFLPPCSLFSVKSWLYYRARHFIKYSCNTSWRENFNRKLTSIKAPNFLHYSLAITNFFISFNFGFQDINSWRHPSTTPLYIKSALAKTNRIALNKTSQISRTGNYSYKTVSRILSHNKWSKADEDRQINNSHEYTSRFACSTLLVVRCLIIKLAVNFSIFLSLSNSKKKKNITFLEIAVRHKPEVTRWCSCEVFPGLAPDPTSTASNFSGRQVYKYSGWLDLRRSHEA